MPGGHGQQGGLPRWGGGSRRSFQEWRLLGEERGRRGGLPTGLTLCPFRSLLAGRPGAGPALLQPAATEHLQAGP